MKDIKSSDKQPSVTSKDNSPTEYEPPRLKPLRLSPEGSDKPFLSFREYTCGAAGPS